MNSVVVPPVEELGMMQGVQDADGAGANEPEVVWAALTSTFVRTPADGRKRTYAQIDAL